MKRIAVVGGNSSLAKYLLPILSMKYEVISMGRKSCDVYCDLLDDLESITVPLETDILIHIAASYESKTDEEIIRTEETNGVGTLKICMSARKAGVKHIVLVSSIYTLLNPESSYYGIYSVSKRHSEQLAEYYCKLHDIKLTVLRPSQIYDAEGLFRKSQPLIYLIADKAEINQKIEIFGNNDALRNYIHVEDLIKIIMLILKGKYTGAYSCTYPSDVKLTDIANAAVNAFNSSSRIVFLKEKDDIHDNVFDNSKSMELYERIKFYPLIGIDTGMKKIFQHRNLIK